MLQQFLGFLQGVPSPLAVMVVAMTPVFELRGAIPVSLGVFHHSLAQAVTYAVIGNMVPALLILFGWDAFMAFLENRIPSFHRFMDRYHHSLHMKWQESIDKYGPWALALFVAIPLPLSGAWSGAMVAWIFGIPRHSALLSIFAGLLAAAAIVSFLTRTSIALF